MRTAAVGQDEQPLTLRQRDDFMRKGLCFNCGGRGHRARDCPSPKSPRVRNDSGINTHAMYFSHGSPSRGALYKTTEIRHVGSVRWDPLEVEEGGVEPIEFCKDTDKIIDSEFQFPHLEAITEVGKVPLTKGNSQKIEEPMPAYDTDMSGEAKTDAPPPVDPVDLCDPLIPSTDVYCQSAERLRYTKICWVGRDAREVEKEKSVRDAKVEVEVEVAVGTKEVNVTAAVAATQKAAPPSVTLGSIPNPASYSINPITTITLSEEGNVLDNIDEIYMGSI
ncbi:hypothetical protein K438DRAFT_1997377 [Mycena galopus ATCC 62051]|nr:hypothetical protein K438DRAFT_1997377 [Mycena galopus ATCC 62051]